MALGIGLLAITVLNSSRFPWSSTPPTGPSWCLRRPGSRGRTPSGTAGSGPRAAAMTYVAGAISAVATLAYYASLFLGARGRADRPVAPEARRRPPRPAAAPRGSRDSRPGGGSHGDDARYPLGLPPCCPQVTPLTASHLTSPTSSPTPSAPSTASSWPTRGALRALRRSARRRPGPEGSGPALAGPFPPVRRSAGRHGLRGLGSGQFENVVVLGIGGSALGNRALHRRSPAPSTTSSRRRACRGSTCSTTWTPIWWSSWTRSTPRPASSTSFQVGLLQTTSQFLVLRDRLIVLGGGGHRRHIVVTTDAEKGVLRPIVESEATSLIVPTAWAAASACSPPWGSVQRPDRPLARPTWIRRAAPPGEPRARLCGHPVPDAGGTGTRFR